MSAAAKARPSASMKMAARLARTAQRECTNAIFPRRAWLIITARVLLVTQMPTAQRATVSRPPAPASLMPGSPWWALVPLGTSKSHPKSELLLASLLNCFACPRRFWPSISPAMHFLPSSSSRPRLVVGNTVISRAKRPLRCCAVVPRHTYHRGHPLGSGPSKSTTSPPLLRDAGDLRCLTHMAPSYIPRQLVAVTRHPLHCLKPQAMKLRCPDGQSSTWRH